MLHSILLISSVTISLIFSQMTHPLAMGLMLLMQTALISLITGLMAKSFWFSYILFLVFLGGMLVLFIYVTSLASNEMFSLSLKLMLLSISMITISFFILLFTDKTLLLNMFSNNDMEQIIKLTMQVQENSLSLNKLYNYPTNMLTLVLMNYLLITLIAVVKITNLFYGPLRLMN